MSKREASVLLDDIRTAITKVQRYAAGVDRAALPDEGIQSQTGHKIRALGCKTAGNVE